MARLPVRDDPCREGHPLASLVDAAVLMHHETPNGKGYPLGLAGNDIPIDARIIGVCDAFDAMTSTRPYRKGMPRDQAVFVERKATSCTWTPSIKLS